MNTVAVVLEGPERLALSRLELVPAGEEDVIVDVQYSGISTGTERLLWSGRMPPFRAWATRWCLDTNRWVA